MDRVFIGKENICTLRRWLGTLVLSPTSYRVCITVVVALVSVGVSPHTNGTQTGSKELVERFSVRIEKEWETNNVLALGHMLCALEPRPQERKSKVKFP